MYDESAFSYICAKERRKVRSSSTGSLANIRSRSKPALEKRRYFTPACIERSVPCVVAYEPIYFFVSKTSSDGVGMRQPLLAMSSVYGRGRIVIV